MSTLKKPLGIDVLTAAQQRVAWTFDNFPKIYVSFSAGKDSSVMLDLVAAEARKRGRKIGLLYIDLEAQYQVSIDHCAEYFSLYSDCIEPFWISLPIILRNAVSMYQPRWVAWDPEEKERWVRTPPDVAITDPMRFPFYRHAMEFEEFIEKFGAWYGRGDLTACFVGIRADESLNRFRTLMIEKQCFDGRKWTTHVGEGVFNIYPIYDWRTSDIWTHKAMTGMPYNRVYDLMHKAGLSIHQMRICQPYGDDQRKGLWLFHVLEPETWPRIVARVAGANSGAMYAHESGVMMGNVRFSKPPGHTWESFAKLLLESLPVASKEHYEAKIFQFLRWYAQRGFDQGIPDEADAALEADKKAPSWRRICKMLLKNDWWGKTLSFSQTKSENYERYIRMVKGRRQKWGI